MTDDVRRQRLIVSALMALLFAAAAAVEFDALQGDPSADMRAASSNGGTDLQAVIAPLNDTVSNCTQVQLISSGSIVPDGAEIVATLWEVTHEEVTHDFSTANMYFLFEDLGLYKIKLTIWDSEGNSSVDFTAVISVTDYDVDGLPDWWEVHYFGSLNASAQDDVDGDGWTNLQEYTTGRSPVVADAAEPTRSSSFLEDNWRYILIAVLAILAAVLALLYPKYRKKRKEIEKKKIQYAIDIDKSLKED